MKSLENNNPEAFELMSQGAAKVGQALDAASGEPLVQLELMGGLVETIQPAGFTIVPKATVETTEEPVGRFSRLSRDEIAHPSRRSKEDRKKLAEMIRKSMQAVRIADDHSS